MLTTVAYLAVLAFGIAWCYTQDVPRWRLGASVCCIAVTWFFIIRFMVNYEGPNAFDGAYADVIWGGRGGNWAFTQALLTWAIVAMVWSHEACVAYQIFGVFGAMSASFLVYRPPAAPSKHIPLRYVLCAAVGFICTWMLQKSQTLKELSWWLWGLHAALLVPKCIPSLLPPVDACKFHGALVVLCLVTHIVAGSSPWPNTDCKVSITIDLVVCTAITVLHIRRVSGSLAVAAAAAALAPVVSPGCLLAAACSVQQGAHRRVVTWMQHFAAAWYGAAQWRNLGLWKEDSLSGFNVACAALAKAVGKAALKAGDRALCVGCGRGSELRLLKETFKLSSIVGLDADEDAVKSFYDSASDEGGKGKEIDDSLRLVCALAEEMGSLQRTGFRHGDFNKILAVDSIYHCDRAAFLRECATLLPEGGMVAMSDVIVRPSAPLWVRLALQAMNIPVGNHWAEEVYRQQLAEHGFEVEAWSSLEPHVLARWLPARLRQHLDYVVVAAVLRRPPRRPKVAVIGSGMSGCLSARLLSETHDVTMFEAGPVINFAGRSLQVEGVTVDVPLRMIAPHYYLEMVKVIEELDVPTMPTRFDSVFYSKSRLLFVSSTSVISAFLERLKYVSTLFRLTWALFFSPAENSVSFGDYARRHGFRDTDVYQIFILPQLSWMLSCDMSMVEGYPATAINEFVKAINPLAAFSKSIVRISPCNKVFQDILTKDLNVKLRTPVDSIGEDRMICGEHFDAVVVATEATAVPRILGSRPWAPLFKEFKYHPSTVILHRDETLLPRSKQDWRVLNVGVNETEQGSMLTVWMNAYYGGCDMSPMGPFTSDVFQTWNPHYRPKQDSIIQESSFTRVVHGPETPRLLQTISDLQGKDGIYYAGAYAVHGMGLLEQATRSAKVAVAAVLRDMHRSPNGVHRSPNGVAKASVHAQ